MRNLGNCMKVEKMCFQFFETRIGQFCHFPNIGDCIVLKMLPKKGKADTAILLQHMKTKQVFRCGIQTKMGDTFRYENWMNPEKHSEIREIRELWKTPTYTQLFIDRLEKYRKRHPRSKIIKFGLCISNKDTGFGEVTNIEHKKKYILGKKEERYDVFYYDNRRSMEDVFSPKQLILVDENMIRNKPMFYEVRPIYTSSGKTNLKMPDIFEGNYM